MKLILSILLCSLCSFSYAGEDSTNPVEENVPHVNLDDLQFVFSTLANDLVDTFDYLESGEFVIDQENTDLDIGKFKFSIDVKTTELEWETTDIPHIIEMSAGVQTDVSVNEENSNKVVSLSGFVNINTSVMGLLKQTAITLGECELIPDEEVVDDDDRFANLFCLALIGINESATVKELKPHLENMAAYAREILENQEEANDAILEVLEALIINETETGLEISTVLNIEAFNIKTDKLVLNIEEDSLALEFSGSGELPEEDFNSYLTQLNQTLAEIVDWENNDESFYYIIEDYAFLIFGALEGFIVP